MAAPTNISALTATAIASLPASITQTVDDAGTTYTVWYSYTATSGDVVLGLFGYGDASVYMPDTSVYNNVSANPASAIITGSAGGANKNKPVLFAVTPGTTYYFQFITNPGNPSPAVLSLSLQSFAQQSAPAGSIVVPNDDDFPVAIYDSTTGDLLRFVSLPPGENGDILDNGVVLMEDFDVSDTLGLFDDQYNRIATITSTRLSSLGGSVRTCQGTQRFWVNYHSGATKMVRYVEDDGTLGPVHTITSASTIQCIAASNDETILYYSNTNNSAIHRWDLVNDVPLSDLVAHTAAHVTFEILVLGDGTIIALWTSGVDVNVKHYSAAGSTLNTYAFGSNFVFPAGTFPRLAYAADDPTTFWLWTHPDGADEGLSRFNHVTVSSGAVVSFDTQEYESGIYVADATASPGSRFGNSFSCPFWVSRTAAPPGGGATGTIRVVKVVVPVTASGTFNFTAGGGLSPSTFTLNGGDEQVFNSVPEGSGYSIAELPQSCFTQTSVTVSNGSPATNISVAEDEVVVVTVTNNQVVSPPGGGGDCGGGGSGLIEDPIRWVRRSPTVFNDGKRVFVRRVQCDFQPGVGTSSLPTAESHDPIVRVRTSWDGGFTFSGFREMTLGAQGEYLRLMKLYQLGSGYNFVFEVSGNTPTDLCLVQAWIDLEGADH